MRKEVEEVIKTGDVEKIYEYAVKHTRSLAKEEFTALEDAVIQNDSSGFWSYRFAAYIEGADTKRLQEAVIEKDSTGEWIYDFAKNIEGADVERLQESVIEKDSTGCWIHNFAKNIEGADIEKIQELVLQKDKAGRWICEFAKDIEGADVELLHNKLLELVEENTDAEKWLEYLEEEFPELTKNNTNDIGRHL